MSNNAWLNKRRWFGGTFMYLNNEISDKNITPTTASLSGIGGHFCGTIKRQESVLCKWTLLRLCRIVRLSDRLSVSVNDRLVGLVVKASASRAEDPGFESRLRRDFSGIESYQRLKHWHFSGYPARRLAL